MGLRRTVIMMEPAHKAAIAAKAKELDVTMGEVVRRGVERLETEDLENDPTVQELLEKVNTAIIEARAEAKSAIANVDALFAERAGA